MPPESDLMVSISVRSLDGPRMPLGEVVLHCGVDFLITRQELMELPFSELSKRYLEPYFGSIRSAIKEKEKSPA